MTVPYSFGAATSAIPLSQLDSNFNTPITLGNTAIQLGNTVTTLNNMTLANVTISSGNVTITNVSVTTANVTTVNTSTLIATNANVTTGNVTNLISGNVSLTGGSISGTTVSGSTGSFTTLSASSTVTFSGGTANGVGYLDGSKQFTTGSALTFDGTEFKVNAASGNVLIQPSNVASAKLYMRHGSIGNNNGFEVDVSSNTIFLQAGSEAMRLTSTGLGIGTTTPTSGFPLTVYNASSGGIAFGNSTAISTIGQSTGDVYFDVNRSGAAGNLIFRRSSSFTESARIDSGGNLLVGGTTNSGGLKIMASDGTVQTGFFPYASGSIAYTGTWTNHAFGFATNSTERARIDSDGNLLVGTTTNIRTSKFVVGGAFGGGTGAEIDNDSSTSWISLAFHTAGTLVGYISNTTSATSYNTSSDYRLKNNQQPLTGSGAFIDALQPKTWEWKADGSKGVGFIAHEVQEVSPGSVVGEKDAVDEEGKPKYQAMEYGSAEFIANIVAELQSLRKRVAELEAK